MELRYLSLILMYILGIMGIYTFVKACYRFFKYGENPFSELYSFVYDDKMYELEAAQLTFTFLIKSMKSIFIMGMIPVVGIDVFIVILDSMLWLNRELGLDLKFLAAWYGPNMEIL